MEEEKTFPIEIKLLDVGIAYMELGPSKAYLSFVMSDYEEEDLNIVKDLINRVKFNFAIVVGANDLEVAFTSMSFGKVLHTLSIADALEKAAETRETMYREQE